jgi:hypothetical protein
MENPQEIMLSDEHYKLLNDSIEKLQIQNQSYKHDIETTVEYIARLLKDLGVLTPEMQFQFSMGKITRAIMPIITSPEKIEKRFAYLGDLRHIIEKYSSTINNTKNEKEIS